MALYKNKMKRKKNFANFKNSVKLHLKYQWFYIKNKIGLNTLFTQEVYDIINYYLEDGEKEIRLYKESTNWTSEYNSIKDLYEDYCHRNNLIGMSDDKIFMAIYKQLKVDFGKYMIDNNDKGKGDLIIRLEEDDKKLDSYILIKLEG